MSIFREQHAYLHKFNVGYIGSHKKLSDNYLTTVAELPDVHFTFIGMEETSMTKIFKNVHTVQEVEDNDELASYYGCFPIFGYPLAKNHYGTCEQVIGEAMNAGCVPVVLNNECESFIIQNGITGFVANSIKDYINFIKTLRDYPDIRRNMAIQAKHASRTLYDHEKMMLQWNDVFKHLVKQDKRMHK